MTFFNILDLCIIMLYFIGALFFLGGVLGMNQTLKKSALYATVLGFLLHSADLVIKLQSNAVFTFSQTQFYFSFLAWSFLLIYLILWWRMQLQFLALTAAPLALILFTSSLAVSTSDLSIPSQLSALWFSLHIIALFLSIALLAMAFSAGIFYLHKDKLLKNKTKPNKFRKGFPSLTSLDRVNHIAVSTGFPLFTVGMLSGFVWAKSAWGDFFSWDPKELISLGIWFIFAYLFHQRTTIGWKGRKPARLAVWLFVLSILSLLIVNFYFPTHHSFRA
ncbi:MAG: cytochrome c biogenesis protein CcsA [Thermodesulfobacteriota bacterium]